MYMYMIKVYIIIEAKHKQDMDIHHKPRTQTLVNRNHKANAVFLLTKTTQARYVWASTIILGNKYL